MRILAFAFCLFLLSCAVKKSPQSSNSFWDSPQAYFGQQPPGERPQIFAPGMLVDSGIVLGRVSFSNDGKAFYYTSAQGWFSRTGSTTNRMVFDGKQWGKPEIMFREISNPALSYDQKQLYMGGQNSKVWVSERTPAGWSAARVLFDQPYGLYNFQPTRSGLFYAGSNATTGSKQDYSTYDFCTFRAVKNDTLVQSLGSPLNTPAFDGDFFIAPDESYIIISAKETPTYECELWISFRRTDKTWTAPVSLGPAINAGLAHRFGQYVTPDGKYLIYTQGTSAADCHFYWVRFDGLLERLRKQSR